MTFATLFRAATVATLALAAALGSCAAHAEKAFSRFDYCAPPYPPPCVGEARDANEAKLKACEADVERYVASVFAYRGCVAAETERAVREANATIQALRCVRSPELCPKPPPPAPKPGKTKKKPDAPR